MFKSLSRKECALTHFFYWRKEHVARLSAAPAAISKIERSVGFLYVLRTGISEHTRRVIDSGDRAFEFQVRADWRFIEFNLQPGNRLENVGGSEFFITEHATEPQGTQDSGRLKGSGKKDLRFVADLESPPDFLPMPDEDEGAGPLYVKMAGPSSAAPFVARSEAGRSIRIRMSRPRRVNSLPGVSYRVFSSWARGEIFRAPSCRKRLCKVATSGTRSLISISRR